jgi:RecB family exonuclease
MREGVFPPPPPADPFFPEGGAGPLDRRARHLADERRDFLVGLATADGGTLALSAADSDGQRASLPSRWLIELASHIAGRPLDTDAFLGLDEKAHLWLRVVRSAQDGVLRAPAPLDLEDHRLAEAARWHRDGRPLVAHPLARRADLPLGAALALQAARRGAALSRFDGNVGEAAAGARRLTAIFDAGRPISASAVESWATCGFRHFLTYVLRVEPTNRPEESWEIAARDRGLLAHDILDRFFRAGCPAGRPTADDYARLEAIAAERFRAFAARGVVGHPLVWENAQRTLLADLRVFLTVEAAWRRERGLVPAYFEQDFGSGGEGAWPALAVAAPDAGAALIRFRGRIDRIDLDPAGRAFLLDYKSGSDRSFAELADDPVLGGRHLQLALYQRAARENLPGVTAVTSAFWFVTSRGDFQQLAISDDAAAVGTRLDQVVATVLRGIRAGAFPQVPGAVTFPSTYETCAYCDFDRVCPARRDAVWRRKQGDPAAGYHRSLTAVADGDAKDDGGEDG